MGFASVAVGFVLVLLIVVRLSAPGGLGNRVDFNGLPDEIGEWQGSQIEIAATIIDVAQDKGIPTRGQVIAVMTAMGESSLRNIDHGDDARNPDGSMNCSLGVFQQQWCIGWGTREQVLDPAYAAGAFLDRLVAIDGWERLDPGQAAHRVQVNLDARHYDEYLDDALRVVSELTDVPATLAP